ncbi:hypothetical protein [Pseudomonas vancouverensis]|uniref:hypothetical protein n=1 Tax=Pseudomonas vancouverensis TaxID=95300 RepID=UPI0012FDA1FB|nr:hypothetical protein [Pseudomonas vancouverensis]
MDVDLLFCAGCKVSFSSYVIRIALQAKALIWLIEVINLFGALYGVLGASFNGYN